MKIIKSILILLLLLLVFIVAAVGSYWLASYMAWPWWAGACLFGALIGLVTAILFTRRWYLRRREKIFVQRIVEQDKSFINTSKTSCYDKKALRNKWLEAISLLQNSRLRQYGNPLYVLPWYMIFGESDSGKSSAIASANLTSITTDVGPVPEATVTQNCDWWFFEEAVVIDTAGRYAISQDAVTDQQEWHQFLTLLAKYRRDEPLNGLILTLSADRLLEGDQKWLGEYGKSLRGKVNELMRVLGARFPVYLLVTKMDLVFGFKGLSQLLPEDALSQAMGYINLSSESSPEEVINLTLKSLDERLSQLRLLRVADNKRFDPTFLLLSDELNSFKPGLIAFSEGVFANNPYQEQPMFRGVYFSSAKQTTDPASQILLSLNSMPPSKQTGSRTSKGIFLQDFFTKIISQDRHAFTPIYEYLSWKRVVNNLGSAAWYLSLLFVCSLLSLSYINNKNAMGLIFDDFPQKPIFSNDINVRIVQFALLREQIIKLEKANHHQFVPTMGLKTSKTAEFEIKQFYNQSFSELLLDPIDKKLNTYVDTMLSHKKSAFTSSFGDFINFYIWRVNKLSNRLSGKLSHDPDPLWQPDEALVSLDMDGLSPSLIDSYTRLYGSYLAWARDVERLKENKKLYVSRLDHMFDMEENTYQWLIDEINSQPNSKSVTVNEFWTEKHPVDSLVLVAPAFTKNGYKKLLNGLAQIGEILNNDELKQSEARFWQWYANEYYQAWLNLASQFTQGKSYLVARDNDIKMSEKMPLPDNPYFSLAIRMQHEFEPLKKIGKPPVLVSLFDHFTDVLNAYVEIEKGGVEESSEKAVLETFELVSAIGKDTVASVEDRHKYLMALNNYMTLLADLSAYTASQKTSFSLMSSLFNGDDSVISSGSTGGQVDSGEGKETIKQVIAALKNEIFSDVTTKNQNLLWQLVYGPFDFLTRVTLKEASCELQSQWEENVLAKITHVPEHKVRDALFGQKGLANTFASGAAKPFLRHSVNGWKPSKHLGISIPFTKGFYTLLDDGARGYQQLLNEYQVNMITVPTESNNDALQKPFATTLTLQCLEGKQALSNYNYTQKKQFNWKPSACGTTTLSIQFPSLHLIKTYEGKQGFADFLHDFKDGARVFKPKDFPGQQQALTDLKVNSIKVAYEFQDAKPVIDTLFIKKLHVPNTIAECW